MGMGVEVRNRIAERAAKEIKNGMIVNLGIGIPSLVANYIDKKQNVMFHTENGILGAGPTPPKGKEDPNLCNAAGYPVTLESGGSYFDSATAFGIIRRGYLDITILGALEVSQTGDLANWIVPGKRVPGMGGAMELTQKAKRVIVLMSHVNKYGEPKILKSCTLPLTAEKSVDLIITDMAVIEVKEKGLILKEIMPGHTVEEVVQKTEAPLIVSEKIKKAI